MMQTRSASTVIKATGSCAWIPAGGSPRVSTTEYEDGSKARLLCHRYVCLISSSVEDLPRKLADCASGQNRKGVPEGNDSTFYAFRPRATHLQVLMDGDICLDRLRLQQENPPHDAFRPQGLPRPQLCRCRPSLDAQQDFRR